MSTTGHPLLALLRHYRAVLRAAWSARAELAGPRLMTDEAAFLPDALSLQAMPPHPAPRRLAFAIMALFVIALTWAVFGKVDIVAVAPGRIIVSDRSKVIQPLEASVVLAVRVKDGDRVRAGQVLIELDPTMATADKVSVDEQLAAAVSEELRTAALLAALDQGGTPRLAAPTAVGTPTSTLASTLASASAGAQLQSEWQDISARLGKLDAEASHRRAEIATVAETIAKLEATVPMARTREDDFKRLVEQGYMSTHATQDKTRERVELERDLATQRARLLEARAALAESEQARNAFRAETRRLLNDRNVVAATKHQQLAQDQVKAGQRQRLTQLTAPVDGIVQQLAVHTVGGVVTSAQPLMTIVPESAQASAEVAITNQDIGFVNVGQSAALKLETFPFTRYGTVPATVSVVTADAVTDEKKGSYYPATLTLASRSMNIDGKRVNLSPGMNVSAEIKTGQRRVIEYLLSPIQRAGNESLRER